MNQIKVWPHLTIVAVVCALIAGLAVAFYFKHEQTVQAEALPYAARIQRVDGDVAFSDALNTTDANAAANAQWITATANQPFSVGDRIYTKDRSHASLAFTGRNFARLNPNTSLDVIDLSDSRTQLALRDGSAIFDVGYLNPDELYEVGTPYGAVDFQEPGLYSVDLNNGNAVVSVLSGLAQVVGMGGSGRVSKGELLTLAGTTAAQVLLSRIDGRDAGYAVDDYYRYQYPNYDGRYANYDAYLNDPYYYDPYRSDVSYQYAPASVPGLNDLAYYGDWQDVSGYGHCWRPRVASDWVPYQQGYWMNDYPYGPTWVSAEPWGYAPYHYGRWAAINNQWFWVPDRVNTTPLYSPALVAFVPFNDSNQIGWVPLGPGDQYVPHYYDANWQPYYLTRDAVAPTRLVNVVVPNAVTVVPVDYFGRQIDPRVITRVDAQRLAQVRPVLDPLMVTPLRNAALHSAWGRGKTDLPPGIAKKLIDTSVITSVAPRARPFNKDLARAMRVEAIPEKAKRQELKFRDERQAQPARAMEQQAAARKQQLAEFGKQAAQGNKDARQQMRALEQQQREQQRAVQDAQRAALQQQRAQQREQAKGERVGNRVQPQPRVEAAPRGKPRVEFKGPPVRVQNADRPQVMRHEPKQQAQPQPMRHAERQQVMRQPEARQQQPQQQAPKHENNGRGQAQPSQGGGGEKGKKPKN
ncbi:MAG TPA: FecR family protein [Pyrinomonadaceae bacterium]|nr:FecR family protein [Pyrinomonadaceae bacterium]